MIRFIVGIILGALAVVLAVQNVETVSYTFLAWTVTAPRAIVLLVVLVAGILVGWFLSAVPRIFRKKNQR
jgi:uncharacterized integral membrane protein